MDKTVAVKKLMEFYGIPPQHNSTNKDNINILKNLEGEFGVPIEEVVKVLKFDQIHHAYETHMRRVGKELNHIVKQISR